VTGRTYQLIVDGELSDDMQPALPGLALERLDGTTALTCYVRDQAELQGLLQRVSGLGMTLLEVKSIDEPAKNRRPTPSPG
jgi:hypothetical protein